jgi:hypothetical protein
MAAKRTVVTVTALLAIAGCGEGADSDRAENPRSSSVSATESATPTASAPTPSRTPPVAPDAAAMAAQIKAAAPSVVRIVRITEDNDPTPKLLGRPNGYTDAAVLYDKGADCTEVRVDCGAKIEIWPTVKDANDRAAYIQGLLKNAPVLGSEYDYVNGRALLRVAGELKPSTAKVYATAFGGEPFKS